MNQAGREDFDLLTESGLYQHLVERGLLVAHQEVDASLAAGPDAYKVIAPERIPFISYPYEWCFSQLQDAALATLEIQSAALDRGMTLRDASAYNIQFRDGRPVLIDTLSFGRLQEGEPWVAYRQFCQHFLAPLALMSYRDVRLGQLLRVHLDGVPLDLAAELLPTRAKSRPPLLMHVFAHAKSQSKHSGDAQAGTADRKRGGFNLQAFRGVLSSLESGVRKLSWDPGGTTWSGYYGEADHYTAEAGDHKRALVEEYLKIAGARVGVGPGRQHGAVQPHRQRAGHPDGVLRRGPRLRRGELPRGRLEGPAQPAAAGHGPHQPQPVDRVGQPGA